MTTTTRPEVIAQLPVKAKPSKAVSKDHHAPVLQNGYLRKTRQGFVLHVTDSKIAARIPVNVRKAKGDRRRPPLKEGPVPVEALRAIERAEGSVFTARNGTVDVGNVAYKRVDNGRFPTMDDLFPARRPKKPLVLALNTRMLRSLAEALGDDVVKIELDLAHAKAGRYDAKPYHVKPLHGEGDGLLMPVRIGPEPRKRGQR